MSVYWSTKRRHDPGTLPAVELNGPGTEDFVLTLLNTLAESIHAGDSRAQAWSDWLIARGNQIAAEETGEGDPEALDDAAMDAWDALLPELPTSLRLYLPEARHVADLLFEESGRIGEVAA